MAALIHHSERWSIFWISTLRYSRDPPTYGHPLNDTRALPCSSRAGIWGSFDRAMEADTGVMVRYRPIRGVVTTNKPALSPFSRLIAPTGVRLRADISPTEVRSTLPVSGSQSGQLKESVVLSNFCWMAAAAAGVRGQHRQEWANSSGMSEPVEGSWRVCNQE